MCNKQQESISAPELKSLPGLNVRYTLTFEDTILEFKAPEARTQQELSGVLEQIASWLKAKEVKVSGECDKCFSFIMENEEHTCAI